MRTFLVTAPTAEPLTLAEAKLHCRIDSADTDRDNLVTAAIAAARERAEHLTGRRLMPQTWGAVLDEFPDAIVLDGPPFQSVSFVKYLDSTNGSLVTLSAPSYATDLKGLRGYIVPAHGYTWPATYPEINAVSVEWVAGYTNAAAVPESIKQYMRLVIADFIEHAKASTPANVELRPNPFLDRLLDGFTVRLA